MFDAVSIPNHPIHSTLESFDFESANLNSEFLNIIPNISKIQSEFNLGKIGKIYFENIF